MTRGHRRFVRRFIENLEGVFLPYKTKSGVMNVQFVPRPIQIWEGVFPEEHKRNVFSMLGDDNVHEAQKPGKKKRYDKLMKWAIKLLKLDPIKKPLEHGKLPLVPRDNVNLMLIGTKKDLYLDGIEQL